MHPRRLGSHVVVGAQQQHLVILLIHIKHGESDTSQNIISLRSKLQNGSTLFVYVQRRTIPILVRQSNDLGQFFNIQRCNVFISALNQFTGKTICIQMLKCQTCAHIGIAVEVVYVTIIGIVTAKTGSLGSVNTTNLIDNAQRGQDG